MRGKTYSEEVYCKNCNKIYGANEIFAYIGLYASHQGAFRYCLDCFEQLAGKEFLEELKAGSQPTKPKKKLIDYNKELKEANKRLYIHLAFGVLFFEFQS